MKQEIVNVSGGEELIGKGFSLGDWKLKFPQAVTVARNFTKTEGSVLWNP